MLTRARAEVARIGPVTARRLAFLWAALFATVGLHLPYFPVWLSARGLPDTMIALVLAAPMILRVAIGPLVATVADTCGIAATLAFCTWIMFAGYAALGFVSELWAIVGLSILTITAQTSTPSLADALTLTEARRLEQLGLHRLDYGRVRVFGSISALAMMLLSGAVVLVFPGQRIIWALALIALVPAIAGLLVTLRGRPLRLVKMQTGLGLMADHKELPLALLVIASAALAQASHAEIYSFGTLHWRAIGLPASFIGLVWAAGVACECLFFFTAGRLLGGERNAASFLVLGAAGALLRWVAMSFDPPPLLLLALQSLHALTFAATYTGSVLILGRLAGPRHRARMQGWLAAASALTMAGATLAAGRLTSLYGEHAYLAMAGLAGASLVLAIGVAAWRQQARHE